jgi:(4S)-4-hydroxy-5-phosphonooxypentane-2,3-dione isomerase
MLKRIVKLTFREEAIPEFLAIFEESKSKIRAFEGCRHLELLRNRYRQSEFFKITWEKTKVLFAGKPEAWSVAVESEG